MEVDLRVEKSHVVTFPFRSFTRWLVCLLIFPACTHTEVKTYDEGLNHCDSLLQKSQQESPNQLVFSNRSCIIGSAFPDFMSETIAGEIIGSSYFNGKVSLVNFWFTTCPPCVSEIPDFNHIVEELGTEEFNYLAIGRDSEQDIEEFLSEHPWHFQHIAGRGLIDDVFKIRWGYPTTFIVDKHGIIVEAFGGLTNSEWKDVVIPALKREMKRII